MSFLPRNTPCRLTRASLNKLVLACCGLLLFATGLLAKPPTEEITRAVSATGVADVSQAQPRQFIKAFTAVAFGAQPRDLPAYVTAGINLRPDLAPRTVAAAIKVAAKNRDGKSVALCGVVERIICAAIAAAPEAAVSIARAAASAMPQLRRCVVEAAIASAPQQRDAIVEAAESKSIPFAFLTFSAADSSGFSFNAATLSPANISQPDNNGTVNSPEKPPSD